MSCVALLGVLPRFPFVISEISAAPEAHFQPATALHYRNITESLNIDDGRLFFEQSHIVIASGSEAIL